MLDFLQMLDFFEKRGVSFVSVTQRFDTIDADGRDDAEHPAVVRPVRAADDGRADAGQDARRPAPRSLDRRHAALGLRHRSRGRPPRRQQGRGRPRSVSIFELYLEQASLLAVVRELQPTGGAAQDLDDARWDGPRRPRVQQRRRPPACSPTRSTSACRSSGNETFQGEHPAIVTKKVFDRVQRMLDGNRRNSGASHRNRHGALLRGILRCAACDSAMTHAFNTKRRGEAYRYYRCVNAVKNGAGACPPVPSRRSKIETFVVDADQEDRRRPRPLRGDVPPGPGAGRGRTSRAQGRGEARGPGAGDRPRRARPPDQRRRPGHRCRRRRVDGRTPDFTPIRKLIIPPLRLRVAWFCVLGCSSSLS